ncbi:MAG: helix-turn-helix domain-containing protein [Firmicutes bacterium]|nr:helix-turn-helix domain-containing protein [Bacillota bacterium]
MKIFKRLGLRSNRQLRVWLKMYNGHKDFRSTGGQGSEIYLTKLRSITLEEQIEIIIYYIANSKDYGATTENYRVSYPRMYNWVRKYEAEGVDGLSDK